MKKLIIVIALSLTQNLYSMMEDEKVSASPKKTGFFHFKITKFLERHGLGNNNTAHIRSIMIQMIALSESGAKEISQELSILICPPDDVPQTFEKDFGTLVVEIMKSDNEKYPNTDLKTRLAIAKDVANAILEALPVSPVVIES